MSEKTEKRQFPCPLCKKERDIRLDVKHGKPYIICDPCGVQMFVRREEGIKRLKKAAERDPFLDELFG